MKFEESQGDARVNYFLHKTIGKGLCTCGRLVRAHNAYCGPGVGDSQAQDHSWCPVHENILEGIPSIKEFARLKYLAEEYLKVNRG